MGHTTVTRALVEERTGTAYEWNRTARLVADAFRFTPDETERLLANPIARLIGSLPFIVGAEDPDRTAVVNLSAFVMSCRAESVADPRPSDDAYVTRRLELLGNFIGGDPDLIRRGMNLIALWMLEDYRRDTAEDLIAGKYNPVGAGVWDYTEEKERLIREIEEVACPEMDEVIQPTGHWIESFWMA